MRNGDLAIIPCHKKLTHKAKVANLVTEHTLHCAAHSVDSFGGSRTSSSSAFQTQGVHAAPTAFLCPKYSLCRPEVLEDLHGLWMAHFRDVWSEALHRPALEAGLNSVLLHQLEPLGARLRVLEARNPQVVGRTGVCVRVSADNIHLACLRPCRRAEGVLHTQLVVVPRKTSKVEVSLPVPGTEGQRVAVRGELLKE